MDSQQKFSTAMKMKKSDKRLCTDSIIEAMQVVHELTSYAFPNPLANGKVIRLGTKKTGSHLASNVAPGFSVSYTDSPNLLLPLKASSAIMNANSAPHPASDDGNAMEYLVKIERNRTSIRISSSVAVIAFLLSLAEVVDEYIAVEDDTAAFLR